ncbi:hypothetical protein G5V57_17120 [Nordella sp. HKS 07]|uniref:hypothetical protein n=1 Tax=Nordella sp. HKS 07 TaxID=2712222 RepID=UPI0013E19233|nr:hypothetical protein [Nordella sp. HKS 07]QIG49289.1 hypothetical protein G5V57_17120 [Nordella sp. HKS 07]
MYDVNPLGPLMHLKELERQAGRISRQKSEEDRTGRLAFIRLWLAALSQWRRDWLTRQVSAD